MGFHGDAPLLAAEDRPGNHYLGPTEFHGAHEVGPAHVRFVFPLMARHTEELHLFAERAQDLDDDQIADVRGNDHCLSTSTLTTGKLAHDGALSKH